VEVALAIQYRLKQLVEELGQTQEDQVPQIS
jgi:hypothetical protein